MSRILYIDISAITQRIQGRKALSLGVVKPERHNLRLIVGGQSPKQYAPRVATNQSTSTRLPAA